MDAQLERAAGKAQGAERGLKVAIVAIDAGLSAERTRLTLDVRGSPPLRLLPRAPVAGWRLPACMPCRAGARDCGALALS